MPSEPRPALDAPGAAPRRLPPQALLVGIRPQSLVAAVFVIVSSGGFAIPVLLVVTGLGLAAAAISWSRFRYGYDGDVLRVEQGVLQRQLRAIDVGRVQQVELDQQVVHRVLGIARLRVETASDGGDAEVLLDGLLLEDATRLRDALRQRSRARVVDGELLVTPQVPDTVLVEVPTKHIALGAVTGARLVFFPVVLGFLASQAFEFANVDAERVLDQALTLGRVLAVVIPLFAILVAVVSAVVQEGNFRILRRGDDLVVLRGLVTRREAVVPIRRVQVVVVRQNWLRRLLGFVTVELRSGGSGVTGDAGRSLKIPLLQSADLASLLGQLLPGIPTDDRLVAHPVAARRRAIVRWTVGSLVPVAILAGVGVWYAGSVAWLALLVLAPVAGVVLGLAEYGQLAHGATDLVVAARDGALSVRRTYAARGRVQGVVASANPFQRRLGLVSLQVHLVGAGGAVSIIDAAPDDAAALTTHLTATPGRA